MNFFRLALLFILCFNQLQAEKVTAPETPSSGQILFLIQQGEHEQALKLYQTSYQVNDRHDFELLHQIGLRILDYGHRLNDPECQLLSLFGASVSAHEDAYYILEESIKSRYPEIQLIALAALAHFQTDRADQALMRALGSPALEVRYEAAHQMCKKKHPQAVSQTESLMYKTSSPFQSLYPPLFAMVGDTHSTRMLRKLLNHTSINVRLAVILSIAKYERDDLLPQVRQHASNLQFALQEACAYAFGHLKDEQSIPRLQKLTSSQYPTVSLAAHVALYQLGEGSSLKAIEQAARENDLFAIAELGSIPNSPLVLMELIKSSDPQIHFNALIALLEQNNLCALEYAQEILIRDSRDLSFVPIKSPGQCFQAWKITPSASQLLKDDFNAYQEHMDLKESVLRKVRELSESRFIDLAHQIFNKQQNNLIACTVELLEDLGTIEALECLKKHQQQLGAPLVRQYCNLALYRLHEAGPYKEQLCQWVKQQSKTQFIQFEPVSPWQLEKHCYTLTPQETSKLLIEAFESFATYQDNHGIETLIEAIATGHEKNKYALAGLLLRATQ